MINGRRLLPHHLFESLPPSLGFKHITIRTDPWTRMDRGMDPDWDAYVSARFAEMFDPFCTTGDGVDFTVQIILREQDHAESLDDSLDGIIADTVWTTRLAECLLLLGGPMGRHRVVLEPRAYDKRSNLATRVNQLNQRFSADVNRIISDIVQRYRQMRSPGWRKLTRNGIDVESADGESVDRLTASYQALAMSPARSMTQDADTVEQSPAVSIDDIVT